MLCQLHYICLLQTELVLKFRDVAIQVVLCFTVDTVSLIPLHKILLGDLFMVDTIQLLVVSPVLCTVVVVHDAVPGLCEQPLSVYHQ